jgi:hypothetical protein
MHATALCFTMLSAGESAVYTMVVLFLVTTVTFRVGCPRLAQATAVGTLGDWTAFFVDMDQSSVYTR